MPLSPADRLELEEIVASGVKAGLSRIGLGADNEAEVTALRADKAWTRTKRLATEDMSRIFRTDIVRLGLLGIAALMLYALLHPADFVTFLLRLGGGNAPK